MMRTIYDQALCELIDEGMDPGAAAERLDRNILSLWLQPLTPEEVASEEE